jgi:hypothetical protein
MSDPAPISAAAPAFAHRWLTRSVAGDLSPSPAPIQGKSKLPTFAIVLFLLGWVSFDYTLLDIGKYSIVLIYIAALPLCLRATSRTITFFILPLISTLFSVAVALLSNVPPMSILSQGALQLLAVGLAAGIASINWRDSLPVLTKCLTLIAIPVIAYGGYQMVARSAGLPFDFLPVTNQQAYASGGYQRGWDKPHFTRASSFFVEPSDLGYFSLWLLVLGLATRKGKWRYLALGLAMSGILFSQSLSAVLGVIILVAIYLVSNPIKVVLIRQILIVFLVTCMAVAGIEPLMPEAFAKFSDRITQAFRLDERADSGRVDHLPACWQIFKDAPIWGHGLASINSADENGTDVTSMTYLLLLMERGMVGTCFFLAPWVLLAWRGRSLPANDFYRDFVVLLICLHLYCFSTFSLPYFLPFWFAAGIAASLASNTHLPNHRVAIDWQRLQEASA